MAIPSWELRQGDPISRYLFVLCAEALSTLIGKREGLFLGISIFRGGPSVTYLFFANDSLLFANTNDQNLAIMGDILRNYEEASGQMINIQKSRICFSGNVHEEEHTRLSAQLGLVSLCGVHTWACHLS